MIISGYIKEWYNHELQDRFFSLAFTNHTNGEQHLFNIRGLNGLLEYIMTVYVKDGQAIIDHVKMQEEQLGLAGYESIYSNSVDHIDIAQNGMVQMADLIKIGTNDNDSIVDIIKRVRSGRKPVPQYENFGAWA